MAKSPRRLRCESVSFTIGESKNNVGHRITVNIGYERNNKIIEIAFCEAGKIGHGIHLLLSDLGLKLSRVLQRRDPHTGESVDGEDIRRD